MKPLYTASGYYKQIREIKFYIKPLRVYYLIIIQVDVNTIVSPLITSPLFHTTSINCICNLLLHADLINFSLFYRSYCALRERWDRELLINSPLNNVVFTGYKKSHEAFYMV